MVVALGLDADGLVAVLQHVSKGEGREIELAVPRIEPGQGQQIIDDVCHAVALVEDHVQELDGRLGRQIRRFYQGLGIAADVGDGSLQLVRDVGYELFPQRLVLHLLGDIVDHDQDAHLLFLVEGGH